MEVVKLFLYCSSCLVRGESPIVTTQSNISGTALGFNRGMSGDILALSVPCIANTELLHSVCLVENNIIGAHPQCATLLLHK
jgi:hypothetical protein